MFVPQPHFLLFFLILFASNNFAQFDPDAGIVPSYTSGATVTVSSSTPNSSAYNIIDGNKVTFWQSGGVLPLGFLIREDLNILLGLGGTSSSTNSGAVVDTALTDGSVYTATNIPVVASKAWVKFDLGSPRPFRSISLKGSVAADSISIWGYRTAQDSVRIGAYYNSDNYSTQRFSSIDTFVAIGLQSDTAFTISEVGAIAEIPTEFAIIDLGSSQNVGWIETKHYAGIDVVSTHILLSQDSINWTKVADLNPLSTALTVTRLASEIPARYIKLEHEMYEEDYYKAEIWEIHAYDKYGPYGPMPAPVANPNSIAEMLGVNGIWGWGYNSYSDLLSTGQGAFQYNRICRHARNYHNLGWDVNDPDDIPNFNAMPGSLAQWWLDWDREYVVWDSAGLDVYASIQFRNATEPESSWDNPFLAGYNYGFAFAAHFGQLQGNGLVKRVEVGNEPWDYTAPFYRQVLQGMAEGLKAADSSMQVYPCALQAADSSAELGIFKNFAGVRLNDSIASYIDGFNGHYYSYYYDTAGIRRATYPENYISSTRGILNDLRFRDSNFPGKKFYVSEWGWDSDGAGESCTHTECVSESAQAIYGVRHALMMSRLGVDDMTWFFYGNDVTGSSLYTRSGLTGSANTSFQEKKSFVAFEALLHHLGASYFLDTLVENDNSWVYLFGDSLGNPTHLVGWRPVDVSNGTLESVTIPVAFAPDSAWTIAGLSSVATAATLPTYTAGNMTLQLSTIPLIVQLETGIISSIKEPIQDISIYPNPSNGIFHINGNHLLEGAMTLSDHLGRSVVYWEYASAQTQLNLSTLPQGVYFLSYSIGSTKRVQCLLKTD